MLATNKDYLQVRNFLFFNVSNILENIVAIRENQKNSSQDLFSISQQGFESRISWKSSNKNFSKLQILANEKESLGVYVSGNLLEDFKQIENYIRQTLYTSELFIVFVEKAKKIFTRSGSMMIALDISTTEDKKYEGIIFPKRAVELSNKVENKQLYWVKARINQPKSKKPKPKEILDNGAEADTGNEIGEEYTTLPKLIIENLVAFEKGVSDLFAEEGSISLNSQQTLAKINWSQIKNDPTAINNTENCSATFIQPQKKVLKIPISVGVENLKKIKQALKILTTSASSKSSSTINSSTNLTTNSKDYTQDLVSLQVEIEVKKDHWQKSKKIIQINKQEVANLAQSFPCIRIEA